MSDETQLPVIRKEDWKPISEAEPGQRILAYNGVRAWTTNNTPVLADPKSVKFPITHFAAYELPYDPIAKNKTKMDDRDLYEVEARSKKRLQRRTK